jgi:hypothetical protein
LVEQAQSISQYLRMQPSEYVEYVGFPYDGWWREREEKEKRKVALLERENESFQDLWSIPLLSWKPQYRTL